MLKWQFRRDEEQSIIKRDFYISLCPTCTSLISFRLPDTRMMGRLWILQASSKLCLAKRFCSKAVSALITSRWSLTNCLKERQSEKSACLKLDFPHIAETRTYRKVVFLWLQGPQNIITDHHWKQFPFNDFIDTTDKKHKSENNFTLVLVFIW